MKLVVDNSVAMRWLFTDGSEADRHYASEVAAMAYLAPNVNPLSGAMIALYSCLCRPCSVFPIAVS